MSTVQIQLGNRIDNLRRKKDISVEEIAEVMGTTTRNVYSLLKKNDMWISQLWTLSEKLDYNFFDLLKPAVTKNSTPDLSESNIGEDKHVIHFDVTYSREVMDKLGIFMLHVNALADEMGFKLG